MKDFHWQRALQSQRKELDNEAKCIQTLCIQYPVLSARETSHWTILKYRLDLRNFVWNHMHCAMSEVWLGNDNALKLQKPMNLSSKLRFTVIGTKALWEDNSYRCEISNSAQFLKSSFVLACTTGKSICGSKQEWVSAAMVVMGTSFHLVCNLPILLILTAFKLFIASLNSPHTPSSLLNSLLKTWTLLSSMAAEASKFRHIRRSSQSTNRTSFPLTAHAMALPSWFTLQLALVYGEKRGEQVRCHEVAFLNQDSFKILSVRRYQRDVEIAISCIPLSCYFIFLKK